MTAERAKQALREVEARLARAVEQRSAAHDRFAQAEAAAVNAIAAGEPPRDLVEDRRLLSEATESVRLLEAARERAQRAIAEALQAERRAEQERLEPLYDAALRDTIEKALALRASAQRLEAARAALPLKGDRPFPPEAASGPVAQLDYWLGAAQLYANPPPPVQRKPDPSQVTVRVIGRVNGFRRGEQCTLPVEEAAEYLRRGDVERVEV
jgi:hypothetical protein